MFYTNLAESHEFGVDVEQGEAMTDPIEEFFAAYPPAVQAISRKLRVMVKSAMPGANEVLYASNNHIGYAHSQSMADRVVYICPMKNYVRLGFMRGTQLADPYQKLVGEGKWLRHVKVRTINEADHPALEGLVNEAWTEAQANLKQKKPAKPRSQQAK
jgi:hypothetical protein